MSKESKSDAYDEGYEAGKDSKPIDHVSRGLQDTAGGGGWFKTDEEKAYDKGYEDGSNSSDDSSCYITTACVRSKGMKDDCEELSVLRKFRDEFVIKDILGKELIKDYYENAPKIVDTINKRKNSKMIYDEIYIQIKTAVSLVKNNKLNEAINFYKQTVISLNEQYLLKS